MKVSIIQSTCKNTMDFTGPCMMKCDSNLIYVGGVLSQGQSMQQIEDAWDEVE